MKKLLLTLCVVSCAVRARAQGSVSAFNTASTTFKTNSLAVGGNGSGNAVSAGGPYYYAVLTAPSTVTSVDSSLQALLSSPWSYTGLQAINSVLAGRINPGPNTFVNYWPVAQTNSFIVVGWSAPEGTNWTQVSAKLGGAVLV